MEKNEFSYVDQDLLEIEAMIDEIETLEKSPFPTGDETLPRPRTEIISSADITEGKETYTIRAMNAVDDDPAPTNFTYITGPIKTLSSSSSRPPTTESIGCGCVFDCSESPKCSCIVANHGKKIPFNEAGRFPEYCKAGIYECGPACKCPPKCKNRVGQNGPGGQRLELFKTLKMGWGVRSRDSIPEGGFICEYVGEILTEKEAEKRVDEDEYLFNIDGGYAIDGAKHGNVGRFVNHSCEPNAFAQEVFYYGRSGKKIMPRIMFFAGKEIGRLEEIVYDYNYKLGSVRVNKVQKVKACHCGAQCCRKRLY